VFRCKSDNMSLLKPTMTSKKVSAPTAIGAAAALALAMMFTAPSARANDLIVRYDQSQLIRLPRPAAEVIIGNPSIADVTIQGGNLLVVTGKTFGITNIIALDAQRNVIQDQRVLVERDDQRAVVLYKGSMRESYTCTPMCAPTITIGDETKYFETITKHALNKASVSAGSTERGAQSTTQ
jgi:Pilus formation protein N terminal region